MGACLAIAVTACSSPSTPSVSVASARPISPSNGATASYYAQPVVIVVALGVATGNATPMTTVEVATDIAFTKIVATQAVPPDSSRQATISLEHLAPATTYYWRVKTTAGDNAVLSAVTSFRIGPQLAIQPPVPAQPLSGAFTHKRPTLTVANANRIGPAITPTYEFQIASDPGFGQVLAGGTVPEGPGQTSFTPAADLTSGATFYWRVRASNASPAFVSEFTPAQTFTTVNPDTGSFRYTLALHLASAMNCAAWGSSGPVVYRLPPDVSFDSGLVVTDDHLRYTVEQNFSIVVQLDLDRSGNQLSGTLLTDGILWPGTEHMGIFVNAAVTSGTQANNGRLTGSSHGHWGDEGFPSYTDCEDSIITFTLAPH